MTNYQNPYQIVGSYSGSPESILNPPNFEQTTRLSSNKILVPENACIGSTCNTSYSTGGGRKKRRKSKKNTTKQRRRKSTKQRRKKKMRRYTNKLRGGYSLAGMKITAKDSMLANPPPITVR